VDIFRMKNSQLTSLKGVGEERAKLLLKLGMNNVYDVIFFFPREYEDRSKIKTIAEAEDGEFVTIHAMIATKPAEKRIRPGLAIYKFGIKDATGNATISFYNQPFIKNTFKQGKWYYFYGKISKNYGGAEIQTPSYNEKPQGIIPIYPLTKGISQNVLRNIIKAALDKVGVIEEYMPEMVKNQIELSDLNQAIQSIHFPESEEKMLSARKRLVFDELFILQMSLTGMRNRLKNEVNGYAFGETPQIQEFINKLPFELTGAQKNVFQEIEKDMESGKVMNRLVQGDVGSGKTIVALLAMLKAVINGYQAAYMVPTEILAEQHLKTITAFLSEMNINTVLLKGGQSKKQREAVLQNIEDGSADIIIGTHALIQESVGFHKLGLVITDEQHRFGVRQRSFLAEKSVGVPDVLVMTATPIPRTLAMILYGDLDISVIDALPKGRIPIKTYVVDEDMRERIEKFIIKIVNEGRQAYIVCPAIEEKEDGEIKSYEMLELKKAEEYFKNVSEGVFRNIPVGIVHGKMKNADKEQAMKDFAENRTKILIATTVIEVGVDVPNAVLMVVENAERFGLAQLHQLRGRVGRGSYQSYCVLFNQSKSQVSSERMKVMSGTTDGFVIAKKDLEIRGPGEFFGTKQHGLPLLKIANLYQDTDILKEAQKAAGYILENEFLLSQNDKDNLNGIIIGLEL